MVGCLQFSSWPARLVSLLYWTSSNYTCIVVFLAFVRYQQNHHQKVFNRDMAFVQWDWHSKIWPKIPWFIVLAFSGGLSPPMPPWPRDWSPTDRRLFRKLYYQTMPVVTYKLLDAQQWLQRLTFDGYCDKQFYSVQLLPSCSGVPSPKIWGPKCLIFRRITLFCLEKRLSKHKMTIFSVHFVPSLATPMPSCTTI